MNWLLVFIGGGLGSLARFGISKIPFGTMSFPLATFLSNVMASIILIVFVVFYKEKFPANAHFFIVTGLCGGFSTFSTFSYETIQLLQQGNYFVATGNILLSVGVCVLVMWMVGRG